MADNMTNSRQDADSIERDVRRTQDEMGETIDKLEEKLTPREIAREALGDEGSDAAKEALDITRQNPVPVALIAIGVIWLLATTRSPTINRITDRIMGRQRSNDRGSSGLRPRSAEPAPIGPSPSSGDVYDRRPTGGRF